MEELNRRYIVDSRAIGTATGENSRGLVLTHADYGRRRGGQERQGGGKSGRGGKSGGSGGVSRFLQRAAAKNPRKTTSMRESLPFERKKGVPTSSGGGVWEWCNPHALVA